MLTCHTDFSCQKFNHIANRSGVKNIRITLISAIKTASSTNWLSERKQGRVAVIEFHETQMVYPR